MQLTAGHKRILKWVGYPLLGLITFLSAAWASFDSERLRQKAISVLGKSYDVSIESIDKSIIPGNFTAHGIVFKTRPDKPGEKPTIVVIDQLEANIGLLALIGGTLSVDIDAVLGGGTVEGNISMSSDELEIGMSTEQLDVGAMPGLKVLFAGLPVKGGLNARIDLALPRTEKGGYSMAGVNGTMSMSCPQCMVGPGKVVPKMQNSRRVSRSRAAFAKEGVTLPKLNLGDNKIALAFVDGRGEYKEFEAVSPDGEIYAEGYIDFRTPLANSEFHHCYRFKFSKQAKEKNARLEGMERGMERARRPDGYIGMRMSGTFARPKRIGSRNCVPGESPADIKRKRDRERRKRRLERQRERQADRDVRDVEPGVTTPEEPGKIEIKTARPTDGIPEGDTTARPDDSGNDASGNNVAIPPPRTSGPQLANEREDDVSIEEEGEPEEGAEPLEEEGEPEEGAEPLEEGEEPVDEGEYEQ